MAPLPLHYLQNYRSHHVSLKQELQRQRIALAANKPSQTTPGKVVKKQRVVPEVAQVVGMTSTKPVQGAGFVIEMCFKYIGIYVCHVIV